MLWGLVFPSTSLRKVPLFITPVDPVGAERKCQRDLNWVTEFVPTQLWGTSNLGVGDVGF